MKHPEIFGTEEKPHGTIEIVRKKSRRLGATRGTLHAPGEKKKKEAQARGFVRESSTHHFVEMDHVVRFFAKEACRGKINRTFRRRDIYYTSHAAFLQGKCFDVIHDRDQRPAGSACGSTDFASQLPNNWRERKETCDIPRYSISRQKKRRRCTTGSGRWSPRTLASPGSPGRNTPVCFMTHFQRSCRTQQRNPTRFCSRTSL